MPLKGHSIHKKKSRRLVLFDIEGQKFARYLAAMDLLSYSFLLNDNLLLYLEKLPLSMLE